MRPTYESSRHREAEDALAREIERRRPDTKISGPLFQFSPIDRAVFKHGAPVAWCEVKCRDHDFNHYPTLMISMRKFTAAAIWGKVLPVFLFVGFRGGVIAYVPLPGVEHTMAEGGRTDRGDPKDIEPCAYIAMDEFKSV